MCFYVSFAFIKFHFIFIMFFANFMRLGKMANDFNEDEINVKINIIENEKTSKIKKFK